jgi:hypothetical protein
MSVQELPKYHPVDTHEESIPVQPISSQPAVIPPAPTRSRTWIALEVGRDDPGSSDEDEDDKEEKEKNAFLPKKGKPRPLLQDVSQSYREKRKQREKQEEEEEEEDLVALAETSIATQNSFLCRVFVGIFLMLAITIGSVYLLTSKHYIGRFEDVPLIVYLVLSVCLFLMGVIIPWTSPTTFSTWQLILLNAWSVCLMTVLTSLVIVWAKTLYMLYAQVGTLCVVLLFILLTLQHQFQFRLTFALFICLVFDLVMCILFLYRPYIGFWAHVSEQWQNPPSEILGVFVILGLLILYQGYLLLNLRAQMLDPRAKSRPLYVVFRLYLDVVKVMTCFNGTCCSIGSRSSLNPTS